MSTLQTCLPHLSDVAILPREIQKSHFSTLLCIYFRLYEWWSKPKAVQFAASASSPEHECRTYAGLVAKPGRLSHDGFCTSETVACA